LTGEFLFYDSDWVRFFIRVTNDSELITEERQNALGNNPDLISFLNCVLNKDVNRRPKILDVINRFNILKQKISAQYQEREKIEAQRKLEEQTKVEENVVKNTTQEKKPAENENRQEEKSRSLPSSGDKATEEVDKTEEEGRKEVEEEERRTKDKDEEKSKKKDYEDYDKKKENDIEKRKSSSPCSTRKLPTQRRHSQAFHLMKRTRTEPTFALTFSDSGPRTKNEPISHSSENSNSSRHVYSFSSGEDDLSRITPKDEEPKALVSPSSTVE